MGRGIIITLAIVLFSCETLSNVCSTDWVIDEVKKSAGSRILLIETLSGKFWGRSSSERPSVDEYVKKVKVAEVGRPEKLAEGIYKCSAVLEVDGKKYGVVYKLERVHSGKEDYYQLKIGQVLPIRK